MTMDIKQGLRKVEFPDCIKESLGRIELMVINGGKSNIITQLISEDVFMKKDMDARRGASSGSGHHKRGSSNLNKIEEFQLILALIDYFSQPGPDSTRNIVFLSLFEHSLSQHQSKVLCKLVSISISGAVAPVLSSVGTWMQQTGCVSPDCLEVAQSIVSDFVIFSHKISEQLKQLPLVAPRFAANVMISVTDLYLNDQRNILTLPPDGLIDVFCEWLMDNTNLCMASLQPLALPDGYIAMPGETPLLGLIRWSILSPFVTNSLKYSNFHLAILRTILEISAHGTVKAINAEDLMRFLRPLQNLYSEINHKMPASQTNLRLDSSALNMSLERFAQIVQVAISSHCVSGDIANLLFTLETLPSHQLLQIVVKHNRNLENDSENEPIKDQ